MWWGKWTKWVKGSGRYKIPVMEWISQGDERYSIRDVVYDIIIGFHGDRW